VCLSYLVAVKSNVINPLGDTDLHYCSSQPDTNLHCETWICGQYIVCCICLLPAFAGNVF